MLSIIFRLGEILMIKKELNLKSNKEKALILQKFFKTGIGEYGEKDIFIGVSVPEIRKISKKFQSLSYDKIIILLNSKIHEERMAALFIMINRYKKKNSSEKKKIFEIYLKNINNINNWDLVDVSCSHIIGNYLIDKPRDILYDFADSNNLWKKRISIVSTLTFIKNNDYCDTLKISKKLLKDGHDLIHKACGWMLREVGKRDLEKLENFLDLNYNEIPRTMLRYSIEKFSDNKRKYYLYLKNK